MLLRIRMLITIRRSNKSVFTVWMRFSREHDLCDNANWFGWLNTGWPLKPGNFYRSEDSGTEIGVIARWRPRQPVSQARRGGRTAPLKIFMHTDEGRGGGCFFGAGDFSFWPDRSDSLPPTEHDWQCCMEHASSNPAVKGRSEGRRVAGETWSRVRKRERKRREVGQRERTSGRQCQQWRIVEGPSTLPPQSLLRH